MADSTIDSGVLGQLNVAHARGVGMSAAFQEANMAAMTQLSTRMSMSNEMDTRLLTGFLGSQLFNLDTEEMKQAYATPFYPGTAPMPPTPPKP